MELLLDEFIEIPISISIFKSISHIHIYPSPKVRSPLREPDLTALLCSHIPIAIAVAKDMGNCCGLLVLEFRKPLSRSAIHVLTARSQYAAST